MDENGCPSFSVPLRNGNMITRDVSEATFPNSFKYEYSRKMTIEYRTEHGLFPIKKKDEMENFVAFAWQTKILFTYFDTCSAVKYWISSQMRILYIKKK